MKHVTSESADHLAQNPFPELHRPFNITDSDSDDDVRDGRPRSSRSPSGSSGSAAAGTGIASDESSGAPKLQEIVGG